MAASTFAKARDEIDAKGKFDPASLRVEDDGAVAGSCAGSRPDDRYAVRVRVGPSGAVEAACECPAARNPHAFVQSTAPGQAPRPTQPRGSCKHSAALLLWRARMLRAPSDPNPATGGEGESRPTPTDAREDDDAAAPRDAAPDASRASAAGENAAARARPLAPSPAPAAAAPPASGRRRRRALPQSLAAAAAAAAAPPPPKRSRVATTKKTPPPGGTTATDDGGSAPPRAHSDGGAEGRGARRAPGGRSRDAPSAAAEVGATEVGGGASHDPIVAKVMMVTDADLLAAAERAIEREASGAREAFGAREASGARSRLTTSRPTVPPEATTIVASATNDAEPAEAQTRGGAPDANGDARGGGGGVESEGARVGSRVAEAPPPRDRDRDRDRDPAASARKGAVDDLFASFLPTALRRPAASQPSRGDPGPGGAGVGAAGGRSGGESEGGSAASMDGGGGDARGVPKKRISVAELMAGEGLS